MAAKASNNRRVTIMLVIGGVAIVLFAAYSMMSGGGGDDSTTIGPTQTAAAGDGHGGAQITPDTPSTTAPGAPTIPNGEFDVFATRNPFEPAVEVIPDTPVTTPDTSGGTPTTPDTVTPPDTGSPEPSAGTTVSLVDVFDQGGVTMATVTVGSTSYTVAAGQTYATSYKVVSLSGTCGQFLYGDSPFDLCEGEQVIK